MMLAALRRQTTISLTMDVFHEIAVSKCHLFARLKKSQNPILLVCLYKWRLCLALCLAIKHQHILGSQRKMLVSSCDVSHSPFTTPICSYQMCTVMMLRLNLPVIRTITWWGRGVLPCMGYIGNTVCCRIGYGL